jgi:hypothetical protein
MDLPALAQTVVALLAPYIAKSGEKFAEKIGEKLPDSLANLWGVITKRLRGKPAEQAIKEYSASPNEADKQAVLSKEIANALAEDPEFRKELQHLLGDVDSNLYVQMNHTASATNGGSAASSGGVIIGGNFEGNIHITYQQPSIRESILAPGVDQRELEKQFSNYLRSILERLEDRRVNSSHDLQRNILDFYVEARGSREPLTKDLTNTSNGENISKLIAPCIEKRQPCIILADFGIGKSWYLETMQYRLAQQITLQTGRPDASLIPLRVTLRGFRPETFSSGLATMFGLHSGTSHQSIFEQLRNQAWASALGESATRSYGNVLTRLFEEGRFLFLLDALDEMAVDSKSNRDLVLSGIGQIGLQTKRSPIILTCRRSFFRNQAQETSLRDLGFEVFYLWPWSNEQVFAYLEKAYAAGILKLAPQIAFKKIEETYDLRDISSRAMLSAMLVDQWEDFMTGEAVDLPSLYERYIEKAILNWQGHKSWQLEEGDILRYMDELAFLMFELNSYSLTVEEVDAYFSRKLAEFKIEKFSQLADSLIRDVKTNSFLLREDDHYVFCHMSIWEFMVARKLIRAMEQNEESAFLIASRAAQYRSIIRNFLLPMLVRDNKLSLASLFFGND